MNIGKIIFRNIIIAEIIYILLVMFIVQDEVLSMTGRAVLVFFALFVAFVTAAATDNILTENRKP